MQKTRFMRGYFWYTLSPNSGVSFAAPAFFNLDCPYFIHVILDKSSSSYHREQHESFTVLLVFAFAFCLLSEVIFQRIFILILFGRDRKDFPSTDVTFQMPE